MVATKSLALMLIATGLAAGCQNQNTASNAARIIAQVQAGAKEACRFVPDADPIIKLIPTFGGVASSIVDAICNQVKTAVVAAAPGSSLPPVIVHGVTVTGVTVK